MTEARAEAGWTRRVSAEADVQALHPTCTSPRQSPAPAPILAQPPPPIKTHLTFIRTVWRMGPRLPRPPAGLSRRRPRHPPRPHHRLRHPILAFHPRPQDPPTRPSSRAGASPPRSYGSLLRHPDPRPAIAPTNQPRWSHFKPSRRGQCKPSHSRALNEARTRVDVFESGACEPPTYRRRIMTRVKAHMPKSIASPIHEARDRRRLGP